jgi:hypothetical protein
MNRSANLSGSFGGSGQPSMNQSANVFGGYAGSGFGGPQPYFASSNSHSPTLGNSFGNQIPMPMMNNATVSVAYPAQQPMNAPPKLAPPPVTTSRSSSQHMVGQYGNPQSRSPQTYSGEFDMFQMGATLPQTGQMNYNSRTNAAPSLPPRPSTNSTSNKTDPFGDIFQL